MTDTFSGELHDAIAAVCPIDGVSIGQKDDKSTWRIDYAASATPAQKTAAQSALTNFTPKPSDAPRQAAIRAAPDRVDLMDRLKTATPAQIDAWVDNNVTTVASARTVFKAILKTIALDART